MATGSRCASYPAASFLGLVSALRVRQGTGDGVVAGTGKGRTAARPLARPAAAAAADHRFYSLPSSSRRSNPHLSPPPLPPPPAPFNTILVLLLLLLLPLQLQLQLLPLQPLLPILRLLPFTGDICVKIKRLVRVPYDKRTAVTIYRMFGVRLR